MKLFPVLALLGLLFGSAPAQNRASVEQGMPVAIIEENVRGVYAQPALAPSDNLYNTQKNCSMSSLGDIESVWDTYTGKGVTVAVIDTGFAIDHPEFTRADGTSVISSSSAYFHANSAGTEIVPEYYSSNPDCIKENYDSKSWVSHGTATAATLAAPIGNGGIVGIAPEATLLCLKVDMSVPSIKAAISYATEQGADVINLSLGIYSESFTDSFGKAQTGNPSMTTYFNAVTQEAKDQGIIVIASAGNDATNHSFYPACSSGVIGVGALAKNSVVDLAGYTNYNSSSQTREKNVDILAPGSVYSAMISGNSSSSYNNGYSSWNGTSFSAPILSGAAALWKQKYPNRSVDDFLNDVQQSAINSGSFASKNVPVSSWKSGYSDVGPSLIENGALNIENLIKVPHPVTGIEVEPDSLQLTLGEGGTPTASFLAEVVPSNADNTTIHYSVDNPNLIQLSADYSDGFAEIEVTALEVGEAVITARAEDGGYSANINVTVSPFVPVSGVSLTDENGGSASSLVPGETLQLVPSVSPVNATNASYSLTSSNETVASVSSSGLVTALSAGQASITMKITDNGKTYTSVYSLAVQDYQDTTVIVLDVYDSSTLSNTSGETAPNLTQLQGKLKIGSSAAGNLLSGIQSTKAYYRSGGIAMGTGSASGSLTLTFASSVKITSAVLVGTSWDSGGSFTINGKAGTGGLGQKGASKESVEEALSFSSLGGTSSIQIATNGKRATIYEIRFSMKAQTPESITLDSHALSLDTKKNTTATLSATISPSSASGSPIAWSSSDPNVAAVDNGAITALSAGKTTIKAYSTADPTIFDTCEVTVIELVPRSLSLTGLPKSIPFASTFDSSQLTVNALYSDGSSSLVSSPTMEAIDTSTLGTHSLSFSATVDGVYLSGKTQYLVSLNGASIEDKETGVESTDSSTFTGKSWATKTGQTKWTSGKAGNGFANSGVQITTGASGANATTQTEFQQIKKVVVHYCTNSKSGKGAVTISAGNSSKSFSITAPSSNGTTKKSQELSFEDSPSGNVKIAVTCSTNSIYIIGVDIVSLSQGAASFDTTPLGAAKAFASYFLALIRPSCSNNGVGSDLEAISSSWATLQTEWGYASEATQVAFVSSEEESILEARSLYSLLQTKYGGQIGEDFASLLATNNPSNTIPHASVSSSLALFFLLGIIAFASLLLLRKKKVRQSRYR
ncbi:MAG: S8 family serine peptidase [Candidatus Enteromonas sp.]|nr:S8 family serine peptidase [Candidatus Enteromonas sp.]